MELQEIDIFIDENGIVKLEVRGIKGKKCLNLTEDIEKLLGGEILKREFTDEYEKENQALLEEETELRQGW